MFKKTSQSGDRLSTDALEIILTGAFETDIFLNFSEIETEEYQQKQKAVKDELISICSRYKWTIPKSGEGQKYEVDALGTGKSLRPPHYIKCVAKDCETITFGSKLEFIMSKMAIKFYEFGFATLSMSIKIAPRKILPEKLLHSINRLEEEIVKGEVEDINDLIYKISKKYKNAIIEKNIPKFDILKKDLEAKEVVYNIISFHRIFQYKVAKNSKVKAAKRNFDKIAQLSDGKWKNDSCLSHFVGIANSAIVYNHNVSSNHKSIDSKILNQYIEAYKTVLETANAYYFIAEGITKHLAEYSRNEFGQVNKKNKEKNFVKNIIEKVFPAKDKFEKFDQYILLISNFFSVFDEFKVNLNRQGKSVWDRMEEKWTIKETVNILENQQKYSSLIFDKILKYNAQTFQWRLNIIVTIFTAIGAISLVEIAQSEGLDWKFDRDTILPNSLDEFVSKLINFVGSALAVLLVIVILCIIYCRVKAFFRWVFDRKKNENSTHRVVSK